MEQVVVTVEALRCHRCRAVMDPRESVFQHEMMTEVSVGRHDTTHTYALVDVCRSCHDTLTQAAEEDRRGRWWAKFWVWTFVVNYIIAVAFVPASFYLWFVGLVVRSWWKRREKRQQRLTPGQTAQQVPQTMAPSAAEERTKSTPSS